MSHYNKIPEYPDHISGTSILARTLDGLGFRFYWSTEDLRAEDYSFRPSQDSRSIGEIIQHVWGLMNWVSISVRQESYRRPEKIESVRGLVLVMIRDMRNALYSMRNEELEEISIEGKPFWHIINGPISDALTHVGQINSFRRLAGNPVPRANVFLGTPPP